MSKSERLFELLTFLRSRRFAVTAKELAASMEVSERTIYRDIQSLMLSGVPIEGEAGIGYMLKAGSHLPPLMFTEDEIVAIELGMRMVKAWSDKDLAKASDSASRKIQSILPDHLKQRIEDLPLIVPDFHNNSETSEKNGVVRQAIDAHRQLYIEYQKENKEKSQRKIAPLGLVFWGKQWTLVAWCELRDEYRNFRVDRITEIQPLNTYFETSEIKSLKHYLSQYK
ncbi:MAG: YafY family transcriptional regulator [Aliivibrio sp.]|uniref:helix-turn-helix transcriptional regulator n=1 Tax=Aliivibrio sp. TaxID=1872443 RepID=UPI001A5EEB68|nr:YafY family transcriptional regulator [Aliivibrio sp.]